jgi:hypothetical protein
MGSGQDTAAFNGFGNLANTAARNATSEAGREFERSLGDQQLTGQVLGAATGYGMNSYFKTPTPSAPTAQQPWNSLGSGVSNGYTSTQLVNYADQQTFGSFAKG